MLKPLAVLLGALQLGCAASRPSLALQPCRVQDVDEQVLCGAYEVWENRASRSGRRIPLQVVILQARDPSPHAEPIVVLQGGPGQSNTGSARGMVDAPVRARRHIVLIDVRGTGGSAPLDCDFQSGQNVTGYLEDFLPAAKVRACLDSLAPNADLGLYTTPNVVDDLDEVREALGFEQVILHGFSGGTRQALVYLRQHPKRVRAALLEGPVPPDARIPMTFARDAQDALDGILSECLADAHCSSAFPDVRRDLLTVQERLDREPVRVGVTDPRTGAPVDINLSRTAFAQVIRYMMYRPASASAVPHHLHAAASGNFTPLGRTAISLRIGDGISYGFYLSSTCGEDLPWFSDAEGAEQSAGTFLGDYRVRQQREACAGWPRGKLPNGYLDPVRSKVPVLILVGERDPVTPPRWGREIVEHLTNGRLVVVPGGGHSLGGLQNEECLERLRTAFLERGSLDGLSTDCVTEVRRPAFRLAPE